MKNTHMIRLLALLLTASIMVSLAGCGTNPAPIPSEEDAPASSQDVSPTPDETPTPSEEQTTPTPNATEPPEETPPEESAAPPEQPTEPAVPPVVVPTEPEKDENGLTEQQRNSFSMLYYLAITAEDIRISKDNRLILDDIYTSLLNDINPGAIDETTQDHLKNLRDIIKSYINISVKRDRLQYIYNQDKAATIRSAVPNPLAILSMTNSFNWKKLATSVVYTVVPPFPN